LIYDVCVDDFQKLLPNMVVPLTAQRPVVLALDGEREIVLNDGDTAGIMLCLDGPNFINIKKVLEKTQP